MPTQRLKNSTSQSPNIFRDIERILTTHKVRELHYEYANDDSGRVVALVFALDVEGRRLSFRMPARIEQVHAALYGTTHFLSPAKSQQAYRTAWANIRDWIDAQMAMIDIRLVKTQEVFLPYLLDATGEHTFYERLEQQQFQSRLLEAPTGQ
ncbi:MAG TPA: hypothetical protein VKQ30_21665 [Ktedonobacterales bacterium]|nr:hypothetical protein [Ktedonobacterales bacterium]